MQSGHPQRWRRVLKEAVATGIWRTLGQPFSSPRAGVPALVIGYHRVVCDFADAAETAMPTLLTSRAMFERHLDSIGRSFRFVSLDEIGAHVESGDPFNAPVAAVTFDDGYRDVYENAFPVLQRKGIPAAVFVVTDLIGRTEWQTHDRVYDLMARAYPTWDNPHRGLTNLINDVGIDAGGVMPRRTATQNPYTAVAGLLPRLSREQVGYLVSGLQARVGAASGSPPLPLTWPMIHEMRRAGFTIGSHTRSHVWLANESPARVEEELAGSKRALEGALQEPVEHFAYPGGQFTPPLVHAVQRAGYRFAYTACQHTDPEHPALTIDRLLLWQGSSIDGDGAFSPAIFSCQTHGLWPPARKCERMHTA